MRWLVVELESGETRGTRATAKAAAELFLDLTHESDEALAIVPVDDDDRAIADVGVVIHYR